MRQDEWSSRLVAAVAGSVYAQRKRRKMSAQQLADACGRLGYSVPRSVLTNLENGRRETVSLAEWLVLAAALQVPPLLLLFPVGRVDVVEPLPGVEVPPMHALHWAETGQLGAPHADVVEPSPDEDAHLTERYRLHRDLVGAWSMAEGRAMVLRERGDAAAELASIEQEQRIRVGALWDLRDRLRSQKLIPPELPRSFASLALRQALGEDDGQEVGP